MSVETVCNGLLLFLYQIIISCCAGLGSYLSLLDVEPVLSLLHRSQNGSYGLHYLSRLHLTFKSILFTHSIPNILSLLIAVL